MYKNIQIGLTTYCSMRCPDCSWGIPNLSKPRHTTWKELVDLSKYIYGIDKIYIVGGEPTLHPNFAEWSPKFKELFGCSELYVWTNGYGFKKFPEVFSSYDWVIISKYNEKIYKGCPDNSDNIEFIFDYYKKEFKQYKMGVWGNGCSNSLSSLDGRKPYISLGESPHLSLVKSTTNIKSCGRNDLPAFKDGLIYPCCAETYLKEAVGIKPSKDWEEDLQKLYLPCDLCIFAK